MELAGRVVNLKTESVEAGVLTIEAGKIISFSPQADVPHRFILPGFIDAHVHIESSMLPPSEFARLAVVHGTVATVSDPHEIANVAGQAGIKFMLDDGEQVPFKFFFGAPPCVPATPFETSGAVIGVQDIVALLGDPRIRYLAEMMNFPGVLNGDRNVLQKIEAAKQAHKPIDGHAPGLRGDDAQRYVAAGISTDHECFTLAEALGKLSLGMKILIREGSAARNFDELWTLVRDFPESVMLCSDDKHPNDLVEGHINLLVKRLLLLGVDRFKALRAACYNPIIHYNLPVGLCRIGDPADCIVVDSLDSLQVLETYINGDLVAHHGESAIPRRRVTVVNQFNAKALKPSAFEVPVRGSSVRVIEALDGQIVTRELIAPTPEVAGMLAADVEQDLLKIAVINRYRKSPPAVAMVKNFGLRYGAIASSVAHDSHNVIVVGTSDIALARAVNVVIAAKGGIVATDGEVDELLELPIGGLMSTEDGYAVAKRYSEVDAFAKYLGSSLAAPFMTLSFLALLVIPKLKLSDMGLFDGEKFEFVDLFL
jgi:adenine deaminase